MCNQKLQHIAFILNSLAGGGTEKVILTLAEEFISRGIKVDLLVCKHDGALIKNTPQGTNVIELKKHNRLTLFKYIFKLPPVDWLSLVAILFSRKIPKPFSRIPSLQKYLALSKPEAILSSQNTVNIVSLWTKSLSTTNTNFIIRQSNFLSKSMPAGKNYIERKILLPLAKRWYKRADKIITVSHEIQDDLIKNFLINKNKITTIYNPLHLIKITKLASKKPDDPWFTDSIPIVLAVGRLNKVKNYPLLFKAIKKVNEHQHVRLIVLGDGSERESLEHLANKLNIKSFMKMPGYMSNPYQYMKHSDVFALSSNHEGLPNVLQEAMACGCKIISTDCPSGPKEILSNGSYGKLIPVNDVDAMASAITASINENIDKNKLYRQASYISLDKIVNTYIKFISR